MSNTLLKPAWAGNTFRLDPAKFPQKVSYALREFDGDLSFTVDHRGAVLRKVLPTSGLPLSIALPARAFRGVAARAMDHGGGEMTVTLELHHDDPDLCVPLLVAHDLDDIAADWRAWAAAYKLPMLMVEMDGIARPLEEQLGPVKVRRARARRHNTFFKERRPRFLMRRSTGRLGLRMRISGREIIARD